MHRLWILIVIVAVTAFQAAAPAQTASESQRRYVCPPCGHDGHEQTWSEPGTCPVCYMPRMRELAAKRQRDDAGVTRELTAYLDTIGGAGEFAGAALLARNDRILFEHAYGYANREFNAPNRVTTRFNLGSMNKMFTAVAIAQLVEAGRLSFDDPLARHLPNALSRIDANSIRLHHLLTHTSGLGDYLFIPDTRLLNPARFRSVDDWMARIQNDTLRFQPGSRYGYSNTGFLLLGKVIEKVSGVTYFDYIREHVTGPAGMKSTGFLELDQVNADVAEGYTRSDQSAPWQKNTFKHVVKGGPAGGGYSTVEDLHRFAVALTSGQLVSPQMLEVLWSPKPNLNAPNYGYGFQIDGDEVGHGGSAPGISAMLTIYRKRGYIAAVLSNESNGHHAALAAIQTLLP